MALPVLKGTVLHVSISDLYMPRFQQHCNYFLLLLTERSATVLHVGKVAFVPGNRRKHVNKKVTIFFHHMMKSMNFM